MQKTVPKSEIEETNEDTDDILDAMERGDHWRTMSLEEIADDIIFNGRDGEDQRLKIIKALNLQLEICADIAREYVTTEYDEGSSGCIGQSGPWAAREIVEKIESHKER